MACTKLMQSFFLVFKLKSRPQESLKKRLINRHIHVIVQVVLSFTSAVIKMLRTNSGFL